MSNKAVINLITFMGLWIIAGMIMFANMLWDIVIKSHWNMWQLITMVVWGVALTVLFLILDNDAKAGDK